MHNWFRCFPEEPNTCFSFNNSRLAKYNLIASEPPDWNIANFLLFGNATRPWADHYFQVCILPSLYFVPSWYLFFQVRICVLLNRYLRTAKTNKTRLLLQRMLRKHDHQIKCLGRCTNIDSNGNCNTLDNADGENGFHEAENLTERNGWIKSFQYLLAFFSLD